MKNYIITSESKEQFDVNGKSLGMSGKRALFHNPKLGRNRIYRDLLGSPQERLKVLIYHSLKYAEGVCKEINEVYHDDFKTEETK
jgi:hypothetical protein